MDKLSSKICRNKNNTDISLYQIYFTKLHENILKLLIKFIQNNDLCLQPLASDNFRISCKPFQQSLYLN